MSQPVNVRSISALTDFRAALATFGEHAKRVLDEVDMEITRAIDWISNEQPAFWKSETGRSWDLVAQRRNELDQCERKSLDGQRPSCYQEQKALEAAKRYVRYVEEKIETVRRWGRRVQQEVSEYRSQTSKFRAMLEGDVPKSLAVLERMILALEAYAEISVVLAKGRQAQEEPVSIARTTDEDEEEVECSIFHQLREYTPEAEKRQGIEVGDSAKKDEARADAPDEGECQAAALKVAYDLQLKPAFPDSQDKVVLLAGCLDEQQVYVERVDAPEGDSGWFIAPVEPKLGATPEYRAIEMRELIQTRPALLSAFALPPGYLAVFSNAELVAVVDEHGLDLWQQRSEKMLEGDADQDAEDQEDQDANDQESNDQEFEESR